MRRRTVCGVLALAAACGVGLGAACAVLAGRQIFVSEAQLISALGRAPSVPAALSAAASADPEAGREILERTGYTAAWYISQNAGWLTALCCALCLVIACGALLCIRWARRRQQARIDGLRAYLVAAGKGEESVLPHAEDSFSQLEDEIYKTVSELRLTREQAVHEKQTLADNLADIAHQIKTPLTSMRLLTDLLPRGNPADADCLRRLDAQTDRLEALVGALLTLSRLDAGALRLERRPLALADLVLRAAEPIEAQMQERGIALQCQVPEKICLPLDAMWTAEALLNLLKNCAEHTLSGGCITVTARDTPIFTVLTVTDTGPGFAPADLPHLFERFYRGERAREGGLGIGLALAQSILRAQDAEIRVGNAPAGGAQFTVKFYKTPPAPQAAAHAGHVEKR